MRPVHDGSAWGDGAVTHVYGRDEAHEVITRSQADYQALFGDLQGLLNEALRSFGNG